MGDTLIYDENNVGGYTMQGHSTDATSISKIYAQPWDIVVLQEQSQRPAFDPSQVASDTYPYARKLDSLIRDHRPCSETMFFMTWGYKNGDASNCASYPPICTYSGMQQRLRESYLQMAQDNGGIVSPVGAAWKLMRDSFSTIDLYSPDQSHPSLNGSYLAAAVFYASIFHKSPIASTFTAGINSTDAGNMKRIAAKVVLDSFSKWNQYGNYTYAHFNKAVSANTATFTNASANASNYYWTFGDGGNSTTVNPSHTYISPGKYYVTFTASNICFSETKRDSVLIGVTGIPNAAMNDYIIFTCSGNNILQVFNNDNTSNISVRILDLSGRKVIDENIPALSNTDFSLTPGIYVGVFRDKNGQWTKKKIAVY